MKRRTVRLSDELDTRLRYEAARRGTTVSAVTREAIQAYPGVDGRRKLQAAGAGRSSQHDIAELIEEILRQETSG
jgi:predicted transcriptional regulator